VYDGDWIEGQRNGYGVYIYANGDKYLGMWKEDRRHGQGEYIYKDQRLKYKGKSPASYVWSQLDECLDLENPERSINNTSEVMVTVMMMMMMMMMTTRRRRTRRKKRKRIA